MDKFFDKLRAARHGCITLGRAALKVGSIKVVIKIVFSK